MIIQVFTSPNMFLHYLGKSKHMNSALNWTKMPKTIRDIIDSNLKSKEILIGFSISIFDNWSSKGSSNSELT